MQKLPKLKPLLGLQWPERSAAGPPPKAHSPPCFQLQLPAEAASLPPFYRTLLLDWVADVSAAHESIKREVVTVDFAKVRQHAPVQTARFHHTFLSADHAKFCGSVLQVVMAKVHICNSIYQERQCPAAVECMNLFWRLTMSIIQGSVPRPPGVLALQQPSYLQRC